MHPIAIALAIALETFNAPIATAPAWVRPQSAPAYREAKRPRRLDDRRYLDLALAGCVVRPLEQGSGSVAVCPNGAL